MGVDIKRFCVKCGQKLPTDWFGKVQGIEFENGWHCQGCAEQRVEKARGKK